MTNGSFLRISAEEIHSLKSALDTKYYRVGTKVVNQTFYRLRLLILIALTRG